MIRLWLDVGKNLLEHERDRIAADDSKKWLNFGSLQVHLESQLVHVEIPGHDVVADDEKRCYVSDCCSFSISHNLLPARANCPGYCPKSTGVPFR